MSVQARLKRLDKLTAPAPPPTAAGWRSTLRNIATVYGTPADEARIDGMTDDEVIADWHALMAALEGDAGPNSPYAFMQQPTGAWTDGQIEVIIAATPVEERAKLEKMSDEELEMIIRGEE